MVFHTRTGRLLGLVGLLAAAACGWQVQDIDRTQPDKVRKEIFSDGKPWYFRQTIIDLPATSGLSFIGEQGETSKIIWQVDQEYLYAYRANEHLNNGEMYAARIGVPYQGSPIAAFKISSHFDVQRDYNPSTGEQTNVILENTTDRPWNERQYMRVDWSTNLIADFRFAGSTVTQQPVARYVREGENSKDAAKLTNNYVDIVHEIIAEPEIDARISAYWGMKVLTCWLYSSITADCSGNRMKVRSSFMKVPEDNVYEPLTYDDQKFAKFGFFRLDRYGYDRRYGIVDSKVTMLIERFNLWKRAPGEKSCRDDSLEHPWANCTNEQIKPIVYYMNEDFPAGVKNGGMRIGTEWNDVMTEAVSAMTGRPKSSFNQTPVFIMCPNNPVKEGDPTQCGAPGLNPQSGDLRYNMIYYVVGPQAQSPLGYGPHAVDPETGEVISANAYLYGAALETYTQYTLDMLKLQNGQLTFDDYLTASNIQKHYNAASALRETTGLAMDPSQFQALAKNLGIKEKAAKLRERINNGELTSDEIPARVNAIRGSPLEGVFFNEDMRRMMAPEFENASDVPPEMRKFLSPSTIHDPVFMRMDAEREFKLSRANVEGADFFDDGIAGWAKRFRCDDPASDDFALFCRDTGVLDEEKAYAWLLEDIFVGVELHEVGHNLGLRHNFAATTDSINYFQDFERDENGNIIENGGTPTLKKGYWMLRGLTLAANQTSLKPEFQLTSSLEKAGLKTAVDEGLREYQYASIMDYGSKPNSDVHGLGLYDRAAMKYGYGEMVDVFDRSATTPPKVTRANADLLLPIARHYSTYPDNISADASYNYKQRVASMYKRKAIKESSLMGNDLVEVPYRFCSDEYVNSSYFCYRFDQGADAYEQVRSNAAMYENYYVFNSLRRGRVGFGMNPWGYLGRIYGRYFTFLSAHNKHFLNDNLIKRFNDPGCNSAGAGGVHFADPKCGMDRFAAALEAANALGRVLQTPEPGCYIRHKPGCFVESRDDVNGVPAAVERKDDAFCANPGTVDGTVVNVKATDPYTHLNDSTSCDNVRTMLTAGGSDIWEPMLEIPLGVGRYALDKYNREMFGYGFYWKPITIGSWWDKWLAMQAMGDPYTEFIGVDARGDSRSFLISFNALFRNQVQSAVGGFINEDYNQYGPFVVPNGNEMQIKYRDMVPTSGDALQGRPPAALPAGAIGINPDDQYMARLQAMFIGSAYFSQITDDQDFNESMFIGKVGSLVETGVAPAIKADPSRYVEITDPSTGSTYFAVKNTPGDGWFLAERPFYSIGYEYLKKVRDQYMDANGNLKNAGDLTALRGEIRIWEIMRALLKNYGFNSGDGFAFEE